MADHKTKIYAVIIVSLVVIFAVLTLTSIGHTIDAATQHFMLFYAGVLALIALCTSVGFGLVSTDRMFLHPGQRVFIQSAHRAASFGSVVFLIIHIVTEILAQRVHVIDAVVPFLSPFKTFYIGLGTIAGDIMILLAITGIMRGRFNSAGKAWRWRAIHYLSYVAFVFGIWHGLLGGRPAKPYYDWTYGVIIALAFTGLAVRALSNSLRPKEKLSAPPVAETASSASAPLRAAAMIAQYGATMRGGKSILGAVMAPATGTQLRLSAAATGTAAVIPALPAAEGAAQAPTPYYEPGYEGPQRYMGARRDTGPVARPGTGAMPRMVGSGPAPTSTKAMPRPGSRPGPREMAGPVTRTMSGPYPTQTGSYPTQSGPYPTQSGPYPTQSGPYPTQTGSYPTAPRTGSGPMPAPTGTMSPVDDGRGTGPRSRRRGPAGPPPRRGTGPTPAWDGPRQRPGMRQTGRQPVYSQDEYQQGWNQDEYQQGWTPGPDQGWAENGQDPAWTEANYDGGYAEQPQWDGYPPESDPDYRYREPGPGMPGYRGAREHRYGGDRY